MSIIPTIGSGNPLLPVITSVDELKTVVTSDEVATLLIEQVASITEYFDTDPTFARLVREAGIEVFLDRFDVTPRHLLNPDAYSDIMTALTDAAADEDDDTGSLQPAFTPGQTGITQFYSSQ